MEKTYTKTVLISGAGRGLGRATAEAYHEAGFFVVATDLNIELLSELSGKQGYLVLGLDVSSEKSVKQCADKTAALKDNIDVLISNAGIFDFYPVSESGSENLGKIIDVNVLGLANLIKYFLPLMSLNSRLIVISSESYKVPSPFQPYSVSKQMLESLYKAIRIELSVLNIKCILIRPGAMQTKILHDTIHFSKDIESVSFGRVFSHFVQSIPKYIGKVSQSHDVAKLILKSGQIKHPKKVYHINHNPFVTLLSILPTKLKDWFIRKSLRMCKFN